MALDCFSRYTLLAIHCAGPSDTPQQQRDAERAAYLHARALYRAAQPFLTTDADCWPGHVYSGSASPEDHARSFGPSHPRARGAWRK